MTIQALFGLSVLMSFLAFGIVTKLYIWPYLRAMPRDDALTALLVPHAFRFIGLSFLVPGVVSPSLPSQFAAPAAYGRSGRGAPGGRGDLGAVRARSLGGRGRVGVQRVGHGRSSARNLPRPVR